MNRFSMGYLSIICLLALTLAFTPGCQDDPVKGELDSGIEWPDLSAEEDVIETIRLVYQNFNKVPSDELMTRYAAVLYDDPNQEHDYVWNMKPGDVAQYGVLMFREEDIAGTEYIIRQSSALNLDISYASWEAAPDICDECLQTTRVYSISTTLDHRGEIWTLTGEEMGIQFVIGPNEQISGTWVIYIASELPD
ncbi:MAG: hypothetical protein KOO63_11150 [Bacteroidales bacterium]|nr:hypothetical protein [Candidatus Latescibacterota bacterium]